MTPQQTVAVGIRVFAVWILLNALNVGYFALVGFVGNTSPGAENLDLVPTVIWLLAGLVFWCFPRVIAGKLLPHKGDEAVPDSSAISADTWLAVGCALIGVWVVVSSLPWLVQDLATWASAHLSAFGGVYELVRFLLGVCLIIGAGRLRAIVRRAQYAGIRRSDEPDRRP